MDGIDISNYQAGIDLSKVPCDFVLILVSEGGSIVNPYWRRQADQALSLGKLVGLYHYVTGSGAGEVDVFADATRDYRGRVVMALDWESGQNSQWGNLGYLDMLVKRLKQSVGTVLLYGSSGSYPRQVAAANGCPTWVAQYASMAPTGYQGSPWNEGAYQADIRQYASSGRLPGWGGSLDLNKYYGDRNQWLTWAGNEDEMALTADDINNIVEGVWLHMLPNNAHARDVVAPACNNAFWVRDHMAPDIENAIAAVKTVVDQQSATITAQGAAIEALSKALGTNPADIAKSVADAVTAKLNAVTIQMNVKGN